MKNIILLLALLVIFDEDISCDEGLLSKFHQHAYKLKDVRIELVNYNKDLINFFEVKAFKFNRTTTAHNGTINFKVNTGNNLEILVQVYKFYSNEYRRFPIRFQVNAQKAFESNAAGLRSMINCGNVTSFRFHKDITYHVCNFVVDETQFPPLVPTGKYKIEGTFLFLNKEAAIVHVYNEVYTPIVYPRK